MFPLKPFHRFALRNVSAAIAVSPAVGEQLARIFPGDKVRVIPNGIRSSVTSDPERVAAAAGFRELHGIPASAPLVVTLGELKLLKGQRDFVLAANEVLKQVPDCWFVIAGKDNLIDQRFRRELRRLVRVFGHEDRFVWLDWLEDTTPLLAAADLFVSPSHSESFGLAMLDAMAAGTPVIASDTDGARELIADEKARVPVKDPIALAERIVWFLQNDVERIDLGETLKASATERFSLAKMIDATESLYQEILARPGSAFA
jgi:glycosyltransferase involved in cell wall biosynthesis